MENINNNALTAFNFNNSQIRTIMINGEPWFVAKDVTDTLELSNTTEAIKNIDEDDKSTLRISEGGMPVNIINESGLYNLVIRSNKPQAKVFKKWITSEVLPSIRKWGVFMTPDKAEQFLRSPDTLEAVLKNWKVDRDDKIQLISINEELKTEIEQQKPQVLFAKSVETSKTSILIRDYVKILVQNGIDIGEKRFFEFLRNNKYLCNFGSSKNKPTQKSMDLGLFEVKETAITHSSGNIMLSITPKITGKGQTYFVGKFLNNVV